MCSQMHIISTKLIIVRICTARSGNLNQFLEFLYNTLKQIYQ
jgi:hypothetical protein